jgi:4-amino-4-deoxy-L-arabinose transferase-like glycosyltransferase
MFRQPLSVQAARPRPEIPAFELGVVVLTALAILLPGLWAYTLIDPWETHYGEVARRMLEERDWVFLRWQDENFQSKPVLTFWLMAASMEIFGVAQGGGYSGELVVHPLTIFAVRLPFALFGAFGLIITWYALARLATRRVAWLALLVLATTPFYFFIARQAITDMPMVACLMGALACFALATDDAGKQPLRPLFGRITGLHVFLALFTLAVGGQAVYYFTYFLSDPGLAYGIRLPLPYLAMSLPLLAAVAALWAWTLWLQPIKTRRQVLMLWFYLLLGVSVLAKGPPAVAIAGGTCLLYLVVTGRWRLLLEVEIPRGLVIALAIAIPWHVAMFLKAGMPYYNEYVQHHLLSRAAQGVHGDTGTFNYFARQLGIGMWPWAALLPAALATALTRRLRASEGHLRLVVGLWAIVAVAMFCLVQTKFHHYIFPAVPALAILVAFFLDDLLAGRVSRPMLGAAIGAALILLIGRDLIGSGAEKQLIELYVYRNDRPWPSGPPWNVDLGGTLARFTFLFGLAVAALALVRARWHAVGALLALALVWALWAMNGYMQAAAPHWGQRALHATYYDERAIHGVDVLYGGLRELADDWGPGAGDYEVRSALPSGLEVGQPVTARLHVPGRSEPIELEGRISDLGASAFSIHVSEREREALADLALRGAAAPRSARRPRVAVDADRLIAWQLNWRGENFWSGGEIWGPTPDMKTVYYTGRNEGDQGLLAFLDEHGRPGQTYFVITEASRARRLGSVLPTKQAKATLEVRDGSCNKFTLLSFTL